MDSRPYIERKAVLAAVATLVVILYGSFFPFLFHKTNAPIEILLASIYFRPSRIDFVANILLYMPLGAALFLAFPRLGTRQRYEVVAILGFAISTGIEIGQTFDSGRVPSAYDVVANFIGSLAGGFATQTQLGRYFESRGTLRFQRRPFVFLMIACWAGYWLFPFELSFDPTEYWHVLRNLIFNQGVSYEHLFQSAARWLVLANLFEAITYVNFRRRVYLIFLAAAIFFRVWVGPDQLTNEQLLSAVLVGSIWSLYLWAKPWRAQFIAGVVSLSVALDALSPFQFSDTGRTFGVFPFTSFLLGTRGSSVYSMLVKLFMYGTLLWTVMRAGLSWIKTLVGCTTFVLILRMIQVYVPSRSAEITDAIMVLALGILMRWMGEEQNSLINGAADSSDMAVTSPVRQ